MKAKKSSTFGGLCYRVMDILFPVCLHYVILLMTAMLAGTYLDAGTLTTLAAAIAFVPLWFLYKKEEKEKKKSPPYLLCIPFLLGIAGNYVISALLNLSGITSMFSNETQESLYLSNPWIQVIGLGLWVPVVEEMIFRGLVFEKLRKYYGTGAAVFFSALIFALYHGNMIQILYAFPMGILLALVYKKWGTLAAPVLLHVGANLFGVLGALI